MHRNCATPDGITSTLTSHLSTLNSITPFDTYRHRGQRRALVTHLREQRGIRDERVLAAVGAVPRHLFFEPAFEAHAYQDKAFPIGEGQTISQPSTVAYQTELLGVRPGHHLLEIGTGSGYQFAVLCQLTTHVQSIEFKQVLYERGRQRLAALGLPTAGLHQGDGSLGLPAHAPYDGILVTAGAPALPPALLRQLRVGGRLVVPVGSADPGQQQLLRITREGPDTFTREELGDCRFVPLRGAAGWQ
ncbi:protein-L-isoaspartate(D-aspartate) O-methyltransferase [Hymenobacter psoromatis]|uniref:protein-L-isoaspartate(D-aspartate) O-methyltransferase n=1 Tax=Hymenobacter psoromatis TaxID=1484116 RepID=UPI001CC055E0|nr:protein-L-isoaspartate(D-aspartate) O-methyltransferase [Hymenobacter psoromatis]